MKKLVSLVALMVVIFSATMVLAADKAQWTMMVFINADNNLDRFGVLDVQEMEKAGLSKDVNIVVQIDRYNKETRRYDVTGRAADAVADDWGIKAKLVQNMGEVDMGDYKELVNFVKWSVDNYPAEKYILVIWNHGAGWKKRTEVAKGISYDDQSHNNITTPQLGIATANIASILGKKLDILAMDACLMQMMEVLYEVRENVSYVVASEETEPGDGWPYHLVCPPLVQNPTMTPYEFAKLIPQAYAQSYPSKSTTQSAVDCSKIDELAEKINNFAVALNDAITSKPAEAKAAKDALNVVQKYAYPENVDLGHIVKLIADKTQDEKVKAAASELLMVYEKAVIQNNVTGYSTKNSTGIAIYFPKSGWLSKYSTLKFSEYKWDEMVQNLMKASVNEVEN